MVKNPESSEMMDKMEAVQHKLNECGVTETEIAMMETSKMQSALKKRRQEDSECPAWARADMFYGLPTVRSAIAMAILKKQGWVVGQVLGRGCPYGSAFGAGSLQPLEFMVKTDQAGLLCAEERAAMKLKKYGDVMPSVITEPLPAPRTTTSGRHPIAALADYCHQMKWKQPEYTLLKEEGLAHKKLYFFQVAVKTDKFTTPNGARNKRQAKSDAASACLERLGLMTSVPPGYS